MVLPVVATLLAHILGVGLDTLSPGTRLNAAHGVCRLDTARLALTCERRYSVTLDDEALAEMARLDELAAHIDALLAAGHTNAPLLTDEARIGWFYE